MDRRVFILQQAARDLKAQAARLEKDAKNIEMEQKNRKRLNKLYRESASGTTPAEFAQLHRLPLRTVESWQKRHARDQKAALKAQRDRTIMQLAAKGWTNAEIGKSLDLHPATISRIISQQRKSSLFPE